MTDPSIFFLSDFGRQDEFVGVVHAVLRRFAPKVPVIDLTHEIDAFNIRAGALTLLRSVNFLGSGVVLAVVDPGVGTDRRPVAIEVEAEHGPRFFVGPDNGLLIDAAERLGQVIAAYELNTTISTGAVTFDGRDRFAPAAAFLASGGDPTSRYPALAVDSLARLPSHLADATLIGGGAAALATVASIDAYGNCALDRPGSDLPELGSVLNISVGNATSLVTSVAAFGDLPLGGLGVLVDSSSNLAIVVNQGSAAETLELEVGSHVTFTA